MAKHGRQRHAVRQNIASHRTKRLRLECLERRSLLSAVGLPMAELPHGALPPALVAVSQPGRAEPLNFFPSGMTASRAAGMLAVPEAQPNMPLRNDAYGYGVNSDRWDQSSLFSLGNPIAGSIAMPDGIMVSQSIAMNPVGLSVLYTTVAAPRLTVLEFGSSEVATLAISSYGVAFTMEVTPDAILPVWLPVYVPGGGLVTGGAAGGTMESAPNLADVSAPPDGSRGPTPSAMNMVGAPPSAADVTDISYGRRATDESGDLPDPLGLSFPAPVFANAPYQPAVAPIPQAYRGDSGASGDAAAAAAARKLDPVSRDAGAGATGLASDGGITSLASIAPQYESAFRASPADSTSFVVADSGFATIDLRSFSAPRQAANALDSSGGTADEFTGGGLADIVLPGAHKPPAQTNDGVHVRSGSAIAAADDASARTPAMPQTALHVAEDGLIDLAVPAPGMAAVADDASDGAPGGAPACGSLAGGSEGSADPDAGNLRPESGVALSCDMVAAVGDYNASPTLPAAGAESQSAKVNQPAQPEDRPAQETAHRVDPRQRASIVPADGVGLLWGAALVVLADRIRLEQDRPDRERRFRTINRLGHESRD